MSAESAAGTGWLFWALLSATFAAGTAIFAKLGLEGVDSDYATFIRTLLIVAVLALFLSATGKWRDPFALEARTWKFLALSALATGASWLCYFRALKLGPAAQVAPIDKLSVVLVAVFAFAFLGERPAPREWLGIAMIAGGALLLALRR
ncbi:MAG: EamA family transporter [Nevskia sp.]